MTADARALLARLPYLSAPQCERLGGPAESVLEVLVERGELVAHVQTGQRRYGLAAPGDDALRHSVARWVVPLLADIYAVALASLDTPPSAGDLSVLHGGRFRGAVLWQHARIALRERVYALYIDRGDDAIWSWRRTYQYLQRTAERGRRRARAERPPPVLIVTTRRHRAVAHLVLAQMYAPDLVVMSTGERPRALSEGLVPLAQESAFLSLQAVEGEPHRVIGTNPLEVEARSHAGLVAISKPRVIRAVRDKPEAMPYVLEALDDTALRVFTQICRNPLAPAASLARLLGLSETVTTAALAALERAELISPLALATGVQALSVPLYGATDSGLDVHARRTLLSDAWQRRYRFFRANHRLRPTHTYLAYMFFCQLDRACAERSAAMRALDTAPGALNTGRIPYYALAAQESEFLASDAYVRDGQVQHFRPDGCGAVRCGVTVTRLWLEIDGTPERSKGASVSRWADRLRRLYAYVALDRWRLRYETLPVLLVVTTNPGACLRLAEINTGIARDRGMPAPLPVLYCGTDVLKRRGPLAPIWFDCTDMSRRLRHAFAGAQMVALKHDPRRYGSAHTESIQQGGR